jgi:murein DD-endopeptidase MepM/ murein hydrolase activator NlpD
MLAVALIAALAVLAFVLPGRGETSSDPAVTIDPASEADLAIAHEIAIPEATPGQPHDDDTPAFEPLELSLHPTPVGDGETMLIRARASGAARGTIEVFGRPYPMLREDDVLWALIGVPLRAAAGDHPFVLTTFDRAGAELERVEAEFEVAQLPRPIDYVYLTPDQASVLTPEAAAYERQLRIEQFVVFDRTRRWDEPWILPAEGWITTPFGEGRSYNDGPVSSFHLGLDIGNAQGTPIVAPAAGRVAWVGEMPMRGLSVLVDHGAGVVSGYHHMVEWRVDVGDLVEPGDLLGLMGSTGLSTGPHLHWEVSIYGVNVDPVTWMDQAFTP